MNFSQRLLYLLTNRLEFTVKIEDSTITEIFNIQVGNHKWKENRNHDNQT